MELVDILTKQLGINEQQASGGLGVLMRAAQSKLGGNFGQIAAVMPGVSEIIQEAPPAEAAPSSGIGKLFSSLGHFLSGKSAGSVGTLASLASGFRQLGLGQDMIGKFINVVLGFVQSKGGNASRSLLEGALA